jgi:hypothetical protein
VEDRGRAGLSSGLGSTSTTRFSLRELPITLSSGRGRLRGDGTYAAVNRRSSGMKSNKTTPDSAVHGRAREGGLAEAMATPPRRPVSGEHLSPPGTKLDGGK